MSQRQESAPTSSQTSEVLVLRTFHVDHAKWTRLGEVAQARGSNRSAALRALIDEALEEAA